MENFENAWTDFKQNDFDLRTLSDSQVEIMARNYMKDGFKMMGSTERMNVLMTEMNYRSSTRIADTGKKLTLAATVIAATSLLVGIIQLVIVLRAE